MVPVSMMAWPRVAGPAETPDTVTLLPVGPGGDGYGGQGAGVAGWVAAAEAEGAEGGGGGGGAAEVEAELWGRFEARQGSKVCVSEGLFSSLVIEGGEGIYGQESEHASNGVSGSRFRAQDKGENKEVLQKTQTYPLDSAPPNSQRKSSPHSPPTP